MKTVAVDWDGVLVGGGQEWLPGAVDGLHALARRHKVIVHTCRANWPEGRQSVLSRLAEAGFSSLDVYPKPEAAVYLDDRALRFTGSWDGVVKQIREAV